MKTYLIALLLLPLIVINAQNAEKIIAKNLEKTGGYTQWNKLNSIAITGTATLGIEDVYPLTIYQKRPNLTLTSINVYGKEVVLEGFDGKNGYQSNFNTGKKEILKDYSPKNFDSDLLNYKSKGFTVEYLGKEKVGKTDCYKVELTKNINKTLYYISTSTYYVMKEKNSSETLLYSNFKKVDALTFPHTIESINAGGETEFLILIKTMKLNSVIDSKLFKY